MDCSQPGPSVHGIFSQEYWSGLPFPPPGDLPDPGIEPVSPAFPTLADGFLTTVPPGKPENSHLHNHKMKYTFPQKRSQKEKKKCLCFIGFVVQDGKENGKIIEKIARL